MRTKLTVFSLAAITLCMGTGAAMSQSAPSAEEQRAAIVTCKSSLGVGGAAKISTSWQSNTTRGGQTVLRIEPYDQVTPALAAEINACASPGPGVVSVISTKTGPAISRPTVVSHLPQRTTASGPYGCVMGWGVIQKGDLICPGH